MKLKSVTPIMILALVLTTIPAFATTPKETTYGAKAASSDLNLSVQDMLNYAQQDELLAKSEYTAILNQFGNQRVFSNILKAENTHISLLKPLLEKYKVTTLTSADLPKIISPVSLKTSYETGIQAEIDNIAMYELFLKKDLPEDVKSIFIRLKDASENHLKAFERNLSKVQ